jgi:hypothetical protein
LNFAPTLAPAKGDHPIVVTRPNLEIDVREEAIGDILVENPSADDPLHWKDGNLLSSETFEHRLERASMPHLLCPGGNAVSDAYRRGSHAESRGLSQTTIGSSLPLSQIGGTAGSAVVPSHFTARNGSFGHLRRQRRALPRHLEGESSPARFKRLG